MHLYHLSVTAADRAPSAELRKHGVSLQDALFVHLYLASMADFPAANAAFARHFAAVNPPARACVEACLPPGSPVAVDVLCRAAGELISICCHQLPCAVPSHHGVRACSRVKGTTAAATGA